jgi:hypothetical protein
VSASETVSAVAFGPTYVKSGTSTVTYTITATQ